MNSNGDTVIETVSGRRFDLAIPDPAFVSLEDIAHALGNLCRFTGHTSRFYSVAEHSVLCGEYADERWAERVAALALLHDGAEAYTNDPSSPLKALLGEPIKTIEGRIQAAIWEAAHIAAPTPEECQQMKLADKVLLATEAHALLPSKGSWFAPNASVDPAIQIHCWSPGRATQEFLDHCSEYGLDP